MFELNIFKSQRVHIAKGHRMHRTSFFRSVQYLLEITQRCFRFPVHENDISKLLQRAEHKKRIDKERDELPVGELAFKDHEHHQKQNTVADKVNDGALHEADTAY